MSKPRITTTSPSDPMKMFEVPVKILQIFGIMKMEFSNPLHTTLYTIYSYLIFTYIYYIYVLLQILKYNDAQSVGDIADTTFLLVTQMSCIFKLTLFGRNYAKAYQQIGLVGCQSFSVRNASGWEHMQQAISRTHYYLLGFLATASVVLFGWTILPFVDGSHLVLSIPMWFPFDVSTTRNFAIAHAYQNTAIGMSAVLNGTVDAVMMGFLNVSLAQFKMLGDALRGLNYNGDDLEDGRIVKMARPFIRWSQADLFIDAHVRKMKMQLGETYGEVLKCILRHKEILKFTECSIEMVREPIFMQMTATIFVMCMTMLQLIFIPLASMKALSSIIYLTLMSIQCFMFCFIGNDILYATDGLTTNAYFCNFIEFNRRTSQALIIFMIRCNRKLFVPAGSIFQLHTNLETFIRLVKTAYSVFAVLKTV